MGHRRRFLIDYRFQLRYLAYILGMVCIVATTFLLVLSGLLDEVKEVNAALQHHSHETRTLVQSSPSLSIELREEALANALSIQTFVQSNQDTLIELELLSWTFIVLFSIVVLVFAVIHPHRIAGPIHVLRDMLQHLCDNRPLPQRLPRENDEFKELFDLVNTLAEEYRSNTPPSHEKGA